MAKDLGTVFVDVEANTKGFSSSLRRGLKENDATIRSEADRQGSVFGEGFSAKAAATLKGKLGSQKFEIGADTTRATISIDALRARITALSSRVTQARVEADTKAAEATLARMGVRLTALDHRSVSPKINIEGVAKAEAELLGLEAQMDRTGKSTKSIDEGARGAESSMSGLVTAAAGLGPALIPVAGVATGLMAGLGASTLALGSAFAVFGLTAKFQLKGITDQAKKVEQAQQKVLDAKDSKTKQAALADLAREQAQLNQKLGPAASGYNAMTGAWNRWKAATSTPVLTVMGQGMNILAQALPKLRPLFDLGATAAGHFLTMIGKFVSGGGLDKMVAGLTHLGQAVLPMVERILANLGVAVGNLGPKFAAFGSGTISVIERLSASFAKWTGAAGTSAGFTKFMAYVTTNGPKVMSLLGNLATAAIQIVRGISPLAPVSLAVAGALAKLIAACPPPVITAIAAAFVAYRLAVTAAAARTVALELATKAYALGAKVATAAQWLLNAAMDANPIGIVIIAVAALAAGIYLLWTRSATFRDIMISAWRGILQAAQAAWAGIKGIISALTGAWQSIAAVFNQVKAFITANFDRWWASHGEMIKQVWHAAWAAISSTFSALFGPVITAVKVGMTVIQTAVKVGMAVVQAVFRVAMAVIGPIVTIGFTLMRTQIQIAMTVIQTIWRIGWAAVAAVIKVYIATITFVLKTAWDVLVGIFNIFLALITGHWSKALSDMRNMGVQIWNNIKQYLGAIWSAIAGLGKATFQALYQAIVSILRTLQSAFATIWNTIWANTLGRLTKGIADTKSLLGSWLTWVTTAIPNAFSVAVQGIQRVWDTVKNIAATPVRYIVDVVYTKGIAKVVNAVGKLIGLSVPAIPSFAAGGVVPGPARGDTVPTMLEGGERILSNRQVAAAGGHGVLDSVFGRSASSGPGFQTGGKVPHKVGGTSPALTGDSGMSGIAPKDDGGGGILGSIGRGITGVAKGAVGIAEAAFGKLKNLTGDALAAAANKILQPMVKATPGGGSALATGIKQIPVKIVNALVGALKGTGATGAGGAGDVAKYAASFAGKVPYVWGGTTPSGWDCCIVQGVRIYGPRGAIPIQDIRAGDLVYSYDDGRRVTSLVTAAWQSRHQPVFKVRTRNRAVTASANHPFLRLIMTAKSRPTAGRKRLPSVYEAEWVRLDQLRRGDLLIEPRSLATESADDVPVLASGTVVDMDIAWLLGTITGDGTVTAKGLNLALYGSERNRATEIIASRWGSKPGASAKHGLFVSSVQLRDDLSALGMRQPGPGKRMPGVVWTWPAKLQEAYLDGYCDADGHRPVNQAKHGERTYHSASRELIEDVRALHISLGGPVSNISVTRRTKPISIKGKLVRNARDQHAFTVWRSGGGKGTWAANSRQGIQAWAAEHADFTVTPLLAVTPEGEQDTWDLEIEGAHCFIADGLVVHNSGFVQYILNHFGYHPPRTSQEQAKWVTRGAPAPGSLAFFAGSDGTAAAPGHVGIVTGPNRMVDAYGTGYGTRFDSLSSLGLLWAGVPPGGYKSAAGTSAIGDLPANWRAIASYMASHGATKYAAAGIAGNIWQESKGNPESVGTGGNGLIGWTPPKAGIVTGNVGADLAKQLPMVVQYIMDNGGFGLVNQAGSAASAASIFMSSYERPLAGPSANEGGRQASANAVYKAMGYASGTKGAAPGWAWVGEQGAELVHFAGGEQVIDAARAQQIGAGVSRGYVTGTEIAIARAHDIALSKQYAASVTHYKLMAAAETAKAKTASKTQAHLLLQQAAAHKAQATLDQLKSAQYAALARSADPTGKTQAAATKAANQRAAAHAALLRANTAHMVSLGVGLMNEFKSVSNTAGVQKDAANFLATIADYYSGSSRTWRQNMVNRQTAAMEKASNQLVAVQAQLKTAQDYQKSVAGNLTGYAGLGQMTLAPKDISITAPGAKPAAPGAGLVAQFGTKLAKLKQFAAVIKKLSAAKCPPALIKEIVDMGVEQGVLFGNELLAGGPKLMKTISGDEAAITAQIGVISQGAAGAVYGGGYGVNFAQQLTKQEASLTALFKRLGKQLGLEAGAWFAVPKNKRPIGYQHGGEITEPIYGFGASGRQYTFGESGTETVVPGRVRGGSGGDGATLADVCAKLDRVATLLQTAPAATGGAVGDALNGVARAANQRSMYRTR